MNFQQFQSRFISLFHHTVIITSYLALTCNNLIFKIIIIWHTYAISVLRGKKQVSLTIV